MDAQACWTLFEETGDPAVYVLYRREAQMTTGTQGG